MKTSKKDTSTTSIIWTNTEDRTYYLGYNFRALIQLAEYLEGKYEDGKDYIAHIERGDDMMNAVTILNDDLLQDEELMDNIYGAESEEDLHK